MAPTAKTSKVASGKDIRTFFNINSSSQPKSSQPSLKPSQTKSSQGKTKDVVDLLRSKAPAKQPVKSTPSTSRRNVPTVDSDEDEPPVKKSAGVKRKKPTALDLSDDEDEVKATPPKKKSAIAPAKSGSKPRARPSDVEKSKPKPKAKKDEDFEMQSLSESEEEEEEVVKKSKKATPQKKAAPRKPTAKPTAKPAADDEPVKKEEPKKAPNWAAARAAKLAGPAAPGSKDVPDGAPNALAGLTFVFTGELSAFSRDEAVELAKRFGGRVTGQPSGKTDYVVVGDNAGESKLRAIEKKGIKTLNEDQYLELIGTRNKDGKMKVDEKTRKKMEKDQADIEKAAAEMMSREKAAVKGKQAVEGSGAKTVDPSMQLWTSRYAPQSLKDVCGNKAAVDKLQQWLNDWPASVACGFKKPGKNAMNTYRAVLITGSPGIGKTTSAHLCAKLAGFNPVELNASDTRSKKLVENGMNINNTTIDAWYHGKGATNSDGLAFTDRSCLIMDEVDGMSGGDRGGVGALNVLIRKTKIPIICIANDKNAQKLIPLRGTCFGLPFQKPQANAVRSRMLTIAFKEKMKIPANVIDQLIAGSQSDIRQVLNMMSTWKLSSDTIDFDQGKQLVKANEKYAIMTPFDITHKILGPYMFSATARETLGDKMELYFQDFSFMPLFIQENYLKMQPARVRNLEGPDKDMQLLKLMDKAAMSISDGDLVDALIHGPEQHWTLMPLHAVCSTVRPAAQMYGVGGHYGSPNSVSFPQWLGQNSKQNKLARQLSDVQIRMRLKVSGDKSEIRQSYIPSLFPHIVLPLINEGGGAVEEVIERMDEYYLSREDWDTIVELGVGPNKDEDVLKKISTATKSSFTRKYNAGEHPIPFHKATDLGKTAKKLPGGPAPDIEDAFEDEPDVVSDDDEKDESDQDISKDKLIAASKKKKKAAATKAPRKSAGGTKAAGSSKAKK
ncbi:replication factor RFC1 C terminal domain-containing protein [Schizophyllum amplum]|uniref:Replication factor C subunit 1 n=1 Tax=Schizophyllum amplum TaxID=97359 RepID=A0A550CTM6_9AGAR|nr:replication factor RFC1 C terminal domain-containing protein [Auriculariopsis ampla]